MEFHHIPIMADDVIRLLDIKPDGVYMDGTLGGAGHSSLILEKLGEAGQLIGIDQDDDAIEASTKRLNPGRKAGFQSGHFSIEEINGADKRVTIVKSNYVKMAEIAKGLKIDAVDGILLDLGVSSHQFDDLERGFSYQGDAPLDMRMDRSRDFSAEDIVNTYSEEELGRVLFHYGEEKFARSIAAHIVSARQEKRIKTTSELVDIVKASMPASALRKKGHPARKVFQALRIECNDELGVLESTLDKMVKLLADGGRLCIITFHSLEDRIVKNYFKEAVNPCICPPDFPVCTCGRKPKGRLITKKPVVADEGEVERNPRSRSAKLRVFEKTMEGS
ncbi:MAG: 16S rRNA (cytosine(1402)-N(4))-methyltransferase RsmH [Eubacterium sp.]|nr:16S rRNA (cytosine(1402)-N(4))-methyltransferase RsmH [Eubacterium sp.]